MQNTKIASQISAILVGFVLIGNTVSAKISADEDAPLPPKALVEISQYDRASDTYYLILVNEPAVGPNIATPEDLVKAIPSLDLKRIKAKPESIIGNQYSLDYTMRLLNQPGAEKRAQKLKKK